MLQDIKLEENEDLNVERLLFLTNEQRKIYKDLKAEKRVSEIKRDERDLEILILQALKKAQWKVILVLLTSPCRVSQERIDYLAQYKLKIFSQENLKAMTYYGQTVLGVSLEDVNFESTNIHRLCYKQTGPLSPTSYRFLGKKPAGALGRIAQVRCDRWEDEKKFSEKNIEILDVIVRCLRLDAESANNKTRAKEAVIIFEKLIKKYFSKIKFNSYNPLVSIFEIFALTVDKGFNQSLDKKKESREFNSIRIHMGSPAVKEDSQAGTENFSIHVKTYSDTEEFMSTIVHEYIHILCKMIYGDSSTRYKIQLNQLAEELKQYFKDNPKEDYLNFFSVYSAEEYAEEIFPRIVELYLINTDFNAAVNYNEKIANSLCQIFSSFLKDIAEFKGQLLKLQVGNQWSRKKISRALEIKDYTTVFTILTPRNQSEMNFWPQLMSEDEKLFKGAMAKGFPLFVGNEFKKDSLMFALENTDSLEPALEILYFLWKNALPVPSRNYNFQDKSGHNLLMTAIIQGKEIVFIKWLIKDLDIDVTTSNPYTQKTALSYARDNQELFSTILAAINTASLLTHCA